LTYIDKILKRNIILLISLLVFCSFTLLNCNGTGDSDHQSLETTELSEENPEVSENIEDFSNNSSESEDDAVLMIIDNFFLKED